MSILSLTQAKELQFAGAQLKRSRTETSESVARLSSGERLVRASDDVASLSISTKMQGRLVGFRSAQLNIAQADSLLQVADNALSEMERALQRMNALAVQANSGTLSTQDRAFLDLEFQQLKQEVSRMLEQTEFNGRKLFRGEAEQVRVIDALEVTAVSNNFDPTQISDIVLWLDGADQSTILDGGGTAADAGGFSGSVATWVDKSGNNNHVNQGNAAERPVYVNNVVNGEGVVRFDGNNDRLPGTVPTTNNQLTTFVIYQRTGGGVTREGLFEFGSNGEGTRNAIFLFADNPRYYDTNPSGGVFPPYTANIPFNNFASLSVVHNDTNLTGYIDGNQQLNVVTGGRQPSNNFVLGDDSTSGDEIHGDVAEVVAFDRALTATERQMMEGYLAHKYGLTAGLPAGHPYKTVPPGIAGGATDVSPVENEALVVDLDLDNGGAPVIYTIVDGNDSGAYTIDRLTGAITIANVDAIDPELEEVTLVVEMDTGNGIVTQDVDIVIKSSLENQIVTEFSFQISNASQESLTFDIGEIYIADVLRNADTNIATLEAVAEAFEDVQYGLDFITERRSYVGSYQARAGAIADVLSARVRDEGAALAVLADTDIAAESTNFAQQNIKSQTAIGIITQANSLRDDLLDLYEGN